MMPLQTRQLLVFGRAPLPGQVKTRLIPSLGAAGAAALYCRLLEHSLSTASRVQTAQATFWYQGPAGDEDLCTNFALRYGMALRRQQGADLGARMLHAIQHALEVGGPAVLIGSDCPDYSLAYLDQAFAALERHDAVLGPAADGGYVLIGMHRPAAQLFEKMSWSTEHVLALTRERLAKLPWRWEELPTLQDVDQLADLAQSPYPIGDPA